MATVGATSCSPWGRSSSRPVLSSVTGKVCGTRIGPASQPPIEGVHGNGGVHGDGGVHGGYGLLEVGGSGRMRVESQAGCEKARGGRENGVGPLLRTPSF